MSELLPILICFFTALLIALASYAVDEQALDPFSGHGLFLLLVMLVASALGVTGKLIEEWDSPIVKGIGSLLTALVAGFASYLLALELLGARPLTAVFAGIAGSWAGRPLLDVAAAALRKRLRRLLRNGGDR